MREKLIELIGTTEYGNGSLIGNNFQKGFIKKIADHLIANGVTIQKWIPVTERLPEDDLPKETKRVQIRCFVFTDKGSVKTCVRERSRTKRNGVWGYTAWWWSKTDFAKPTHWMHLPEPPKGE